MSRINRSRVEQLPGRIRVERNQNQLWSPFFAFPTKCYDIRYYMAGSSCLFGPRSPLFAFWLSGYDMQKLEWGSARFARPSKNSPNPWYYSRQKRRWQWVTQVLSSSVGFRALKGWHTSHFSQEFVRILHLQPAVLHFQRPRILPGAPFQADSVLLPQRISRREGPRDTHSLPMRRRSVFFFFFIRNRVS